MRIRMTIYGCTLRSVHDGDSFRAVGDARAIIPDTPIDGWQPKVRCSGVDAPERGEPGWEEAKTLLTEWLASGHFNLVCYGRDKYGRLLADAERGGQYLSSYLQANGVPKMSENTMRTLVVE